MENNQPVQTLYEVENTLPKDKGARRALVRRFVVLATTMHEAIDRAIDHNTLHVLGECDAATLAEARAASLASDGTWTAVPVDGLVVQRQSKLR